MNAALLTPMPAYRSIALVIALATGVTGCRDSPELVLQNARDSLAEVNKTACGNKERLGDALQDLSKYIEPRAAALIRSAPDVEKSSSGQFKVFVTCKPPPSVLPPGEVVKVEQPSEITAFIKLQGKAGKPGPEVPMVLIDGRWKIDLLEMESFTQAIKTK